MKRSHEKASRSFFRCICKPPAAARLCTVQCSVSVFLFLASLLAHPGFADVVMNFEVPGADQKMSGIAPISGWAFSTTGAPVTVSLQIDTSAPSTVPCCADRLDVAQLHGPQGLMSGFGQIFNFNNLSAGEHTVTITARDGVAEKAESHKISVIKPGGFNFLSRLDVVFSNASIQDKKEIVIEKAHAIDKATNKDQEVKLTLAWQENTQTLNIVKSENTGSATPVGSAMTQAETAAQAENDAVATELQLAFENPPANLTASGVGVISGWTFSPNAGAAYPPIVEFRVDNSDFKRIPCCQERLDVANAFHSQKELALRSGFGALFNFNQLSSDEHTIEIRVQDGTGATKSETRTITVIKPGDFAFLDQFDLSEAEAFISGLSLVLDKVKVRDQATQQTREVSAHYTWEASCQCFIAQGVCGNGGVEPGEECDGESLDNQTCQSLGFRSGTLKCAESCILDMTGCDGGPRVLVTNLISNTVSFINTATNTVQATVSVGREPRGIAVNPVSPTAYVANFGSDTLSVLDTVAAKVTDTIQLPGTRQGPQGVTVSPDGRRVYVVNGRANSVSVIDVQTKTVIATVPVGAQPQDLALTPDGARLYITNYGSNSVSVMDAQTNAIVTTIPVGQGPDGVAVSPKNDAHRAYVAHYLDGSAFAIDTATNTTIGDAVRLSFRPTKVAFAPDGGRVYIANFLADIVSVIDPATNQVLNSIFTSEDPDGLVITPNGKRLYIALLGDNGRGHHVQVTSTVTNSNIAGFIEVGEGPFALAVAP